MIKIVLLFLCALAPLNAHITFQKANPQDVTELQNHMISFYSEQLLQAGIFERADEAKEAAEKEVKLDLDDPTQTFWYVHLTSCDTATRYGYLIYSTEEKKAYLEAIFLEKSYRSLGLGKETLQKLETVLKTKNIETIKLFVFAHNKPALELYRKLGYEIETSWTQDGKSIGYHLKKSCL